MEGLPDGPQREAALAAFRAAVLPLLDRSAFILHGSLAAAEDAGVFRGEPARALLTARRGDRLDPPREAERAAQHWLEAAPPYDLADPLHDTYAVAVHDVLPHSVELRAQVATALALEGGPLAGEAVLPGLARLVRLADLVGVDTDVPAFRERVATALRKLRRDGVWDSGPGRSAS